VIGFVIGEVVSSKDLMQELKTRVRGETPVIISCVTCLYFDAPRRD
jgi:hypothetical protein